jgi:tetratricopeptide (TPR) repeat protein
MRRRKPMPVQAVSSGTHAFLADLPADIGSLLTWFEAGAKPEDGGKELDQFARGFLAALAEVEALIPSMNAHPAKLLGLLLTHHRRNPSSSGAWLNLGWSLRIIATGDPESRAAIRLQNALDCFDRSISLAEDERAMVIRAWAGKAFVNAQFERSEEAVHCSREALHLDRSDPNLWLLHSHMLGAAGRNEEALELIDEAYKAYVMAGRPEGLRHIFDDVVSPLHTPDPAEHIGTTQ